jgi:tetratricopeptide (TPR) repeat protein
MSGEMHPSQSNFPAESLPGQEEPCVPGADYTHFSGIGHSELDAAAIAPDIETAEIHYRRAVENYRQATALCGSHEDPLESSHIGQCLALALEKLGEHEEALQLYFTHVAILESLPGDNHQDLPTTCYNLAICLEQMGETQESLVFSRRALAGFEATLGTDHPHTISSRRFVADTLCDCGAYALAEPLHRENLLAMERNHGARHPEVFPYCMFLAMCLNRLEKMDEALALARSAAEGFSEIHGKDHHDTQFAEEIADLMESGFTSSLGFPRSEY